MGQVFRNPVEVAGFHQGGDGLVGGEGVVGESEAPGIEEGSGGYVEGAAGLFPVGLGRQEDLAEHVVGDNGPALVETADL